LEIARPLGLSEQISACNYSLALLDLAHGRSGEAFDGLMLIVSEGHIVYRFIAMADLVEAAARAGRQEDARGAVAWFDPWGKGADARLVPALARALLPAVDEDPEPGFIAALEACVNTGAPYLLHRTQLCYGEFLRRARRKSDSRTQLRAALHG